MPMLERGAFGWGLYAKPMGAWSYVCRGKGETFPGRGSVWRVVAWETYGCVDVGDHSLTGQRMAPHTPQESPQVKTKCIRARVVFTLPWSHLPRTRAYVRGTLKKSR